MKGFQTIFVHGAALFVRKERGASFLVFNPADNVGIVFSVNELLMLADVIDGRSLDHYSELNRFRNLLVALSINL